MWQIILISYIIINVIGGFCEIVMERRMLTNLVVEAAGEFRELTSITINDKFVYCTLWLVMYGLLYLFYVIAWAPLWMFYFRTK